MDASIDTLFGSRPTSSVPLRLYVCFKLRIIKELGLLAAIVEKLDIGTLFLALIGLYVSDGVMDASIDTLFGSRPTSSVPLRLYVCFKLRIIKESGLLAAIVEKLNIGTLFLAPIGLCIGWAYG